MEDLRETDFPIASKVVVYLTQYLDTASFGMFLPLLPYYYKTLPGYSAASAGLDFSLLTAGFSLGQFLGSLVLGFASDRWGRKKILLVGLVGGCACGVYTALAPSLWQLAVARTLAGVFAGTGGLLSSYVADVTCRRDRSKWMGRLGAASAVGLASGPAIGIIFGYVLYKKSGGVSTAFFAASITGSGLALVAFVIALIRFKESPRFIDGSVLKRPVVSASNVWSIVASRDVMVLLVVTFLFSCYFTVFETALALLLLNDYEWPPWQVIVIYGAFVVVMFLVQAVIFGPLTKRLHPKWVAFGGFIIGTVAMALFPVWKNQFVVGAISIVYGFATVSPVCLSVIATFLSTGMHGTILGVRRSVACLARAAGPLLAGTLYDIHFGTFLPSREPHALSFWVGSGVALCACVSLLIMSKVEVEKQPAVLPSYANAKFDAGSAIPQLDEHSKLIN